MTNEDVRSPAARLFQLWVTSSLKGKALPVNYYTKWDHRKIMTSSTALNTFIFFAALGGSANSRGSELPLTYSALEFTFAILQSRALSLFMQSPCLYLHSFSYNIIPCSEGKHDQKLPNHFLTNQLILKKDHNLIVIVDRDLSDAMVPTCVGQGGLLSPLMDLVSRDDKIQFLFLVLLLVTLSPLKNIYTCVEIIPSISPEVPSVVLPDDGERLCKLDLTANGAKHREKDQPDSKRLIHQSHS